MKEFLAVFNSDQVNAYGIQVPIGTLLSAVEQEWLVGQPMFISHDRHRLKGWTRALGVHLEPGLARLTGLCYFPEVEAEAEELKRFVWSYFDRRIVEEMEPHRCELEQRLRPFLQGNEKPIIMDAAALYGNGLAARTFADVFAGRDKDGLVLLKNLDAVAPGVFQQDGLLFFASSYLRRSLSRLNTLNDPVLRRLHALAENAALEVKIRLDADIVGLLATYQTPLEFAYWWGPKFDDDLLSVPLGIATHNADDRQRMFSGVSRTEFWWHDQSGLRSFECEEILDIPSMGLGQDVYGCRYAHSIVDPSNNTPVHLDGAVRLYDQYKIIERLDKNLYTAGRHSDYTKLWRIDGPIALSLWKELITHHFRDNELVGEYFGGRDESGHLRPTVLSPPSDSIYRFVPCTMSPGEGVRISIAYHQPHSSSAFPVELIPLDTFGTAEHRSYYVEADTFEVVKALHREGVTVSAPEGLMRLAFEDTATNLSLIVHRGASAAVVASQTLKTVHTLCDTWVKRGNDRVVSLVVGIEYVDRAVYFSFAGHVVDLQQFFVGFGTILPATILDIKSWAVAALNKLSALFTRSGDKPRLGDMMQHTGILQFDRKIIEPERYKLGQDPEGRPAVTFAIPRSEGELIELVTSGRLTWADIWVVHRSVCSACQKDYLECGCSKYVNDRVTQRMEEVELCGLFWTNRPASAQINLVPER
jgi:hypothetical protein